MRISEINIYPVKSLSSIALRKAPVEERGLTNDRRFMLIDRNNDLLTQREFSKMATVKVEVDEIGLKISSEKNGEVLVPFEFANAKTETVRVWDSYCEAQIAGDGINSWFSSVLETDCRLVYMPPATRRQINEDFNEGDEIVSFADGYPILIIGEKSLAGLNTKLENEIPMSRFRPNLVFSGGEPFLEDGWKRIRIGETILRLTKPCARCVITTIDQKTGISDIKEPLKTLASFRKPTDVYPDTFEDLGLGKNDVLFGQNLVAENFGEEIRIGDEVEVLE